MHEKRDFRNDHKNDECFRESERGDEFKLNRLNLIKLN